MSRTNQKRMMAETRLSVHVYNKKVSNSSVFALRLKVLRSWADLQLYDIANIDRCLIITTRARLRQAINPGKDPRARAGKSSSATEL